MLLKISNMDTMEFQFEKYDFPDYTPFSPSSNPLFFEQGCRFLMDDICSEKTIEVTKKHFEELVGLSNELQHEYVEYYSSENKYYLTQDTYEDKLYDGYFMTIKDKIILFFIRASP